MPNDESENKYPTLDTLRTTVQRALYIGPLFDVELRLITMLEDYLKRQGQALGLPQRTIEQLILGATDEKKD